MSFRILCRACCGCFLHHFSPASRATEKGLAQEEKDAGFAPLFNGTDLTGWRFGEESPPKEMPANWQVEEGVIRVTGGGSPHLASAKEYGNFELRLEWRGLKEKYNSGLFIRSGKKVGANQINLAYKSEGAFLGGKMQGAKAVGEWQKPAGERNACRVLSAGDKLPLWCTGFQAGGETAPPTATGSFGLRGRDPHLGFVSVSRPGGWARCG